MSPKKCQIKECIKSVNAKGFCMFHYGNLRRNGDPLTVARKRNICSISECGKFAHGYNLCRNHYHELDFVQEAKQKHRKLISSRYQSILRYNKKHFPQTKTISLSEYRQLIENNSCTYCSGKLNEQGHGLDRIDNFEGYSLCNVLPACGDCNRLRGDRLTVEETKLLVITLILSRYTRSVA